MNNDTKMPMDANGHNTKDTILQEKTQQQELKEWRVCGLRKRTLIALSGLLIVVIICAIVIPTVIVSKANQSSTLAPSSSTPSSDNDNNNTVNPSSAPEPNFDNQFQGDEEIYGTGKFNNSGRVNAWTPALTESFDYGGKHKIHGVNLGGWLVIEPFITPGLFDQFHPSDKVVDEWTLCQKLGPDQAKRQLEHHYDTFITEQDFKKIAEMGLNHVRIPVGHWAVRQDQPFVSHLSFKYLLRGIQWARKYGLRVMVELHTAPGSQNGWNHSGRMGSVGFLNGTHGDENAAATLEVVKELVTFFSKPEWAPVATLFGVLNEPAIYRLDKSRVQKWYQDSYDSLRNGNNTTDNGPWLTYHEGFLGLSSWNGFFNNNHYKRTILETHTYLIFDQGLVSMPRDEQAEFPCTGWMDDLKQASEDDGLTMVGEFSVATNDCGKYLNGVGLGTRYEGTLMVDGETLPAVCDGCSCGDSEQWQTFDDKYKRFLLNFVSRQMYAFESSTVGWFFWTYKTENHVNPHWDYLLGYEQNWMPKDAGRRDISC
ncbi:glycoside hydrolase superfamily [Chlamydoabsidia padenii]|nr:glycoside hydrolase superfamily [Chlamydoabsidia padenii]